MALARLKRNKGFQNTHPLFSSVQHHLYS